jgi:hypothetical protein
MVMTARIDVMSAAGLTSALLARKSAIASSKRCAMVSGVNRVIAGLIRIADKAMNTLVRALANRVLRISS